MASGIRRSQHLTSDNLHGPGVNPRARHLNDGVAPSMRNGRTSELVRLHLSSKTRNVQQG
jgi:hypothetical protein